MIAALRTGDIEVVYQPSHIAANGFPTRKDELRAFDVVILSDIGANTLLLPDRVSVRSERTANRLFLLSEFVGEGGGTRSTYVAVRAERRSHEARAE